MELIVLDTNFKHVAIVDSFKSLIWTDRFNAYGDFELYQGMSSEAIKFMRPDYYLWIKSSEHCMIIEDLAVDSDLEEGNFLVVTGRSLESILERRIVWGLKVLSGNLQNAIRTLLNEAIISPSIANRKIPNFIFEASTDPKITNLAIEETQFFGEDLYTVVKTLCETNKIGFKIVLNEQDQFVFSLYAGTDRSYRQDENPYVIFAPNFDNIMSSNYYTSKADYKNVTLIGGEGEGNERKLVTVGSGSGMNRRELFTDARDVSSKVDEVALSDAEYTRQLQAKGKEQLTEHKVKEAFEGEVDATQLFKYGEDFFIGDIVEIMDMHGNEGQVYISELVISESNDEVSVYPTFQKIEEGGTTL